MNAQFDAHLAGRLGDLERDGLYKTERLITGAQGAHVDIRTDGTAHPVINLCANNYLGLAGDRRLVEAAKHALDEYGFGMASVRFICGTGTIHRDLEQALARFLRKDDAILYAACFDANGGLFEALLGPEDAVVSDALNHASIIDGIRLCKARRYRFANSDMDDLEAQLKQARADGARHVMIATDGVFSMDGYFAKLDEITALAGRYEALVMVDDCHATGFIGPEGRGSAARLGVEDKVDILTGTLGKALGGAIGGYVAASQRIIDMLRQVSRPYLFSNSLPPAVAAAGIAALDIVRIADDLRDRLVGNAAYWRDGLETRGFTLLEGEHPIIPVMLGDAALAQRMAAGLYEAGIYVTGFFFPVVPRGQARIRTQMNAALTRDDLDKALDAFEETARAEGVL